MEYVSDVCLEIIIKIFEIGKSWREKTQLELVHSDLCSMNKPFLAGARYVLTFIDDFFPGILGYIY
jgi:hypothetical protein